MNEGWAGRPAAAACARVRASLLVLLFSLWGGGSVLHADAGPSDTTRVPQYFPPLERPPLDPPLQLSASFGEYRIGHFHAGLDFSTDEQVGRPVYASLPGYVVRVRASGVGYGRSVYVQADDGRLLVYGHLDAFDEPLASYVDSVQVATGQYEQDLWPDPPSAGTPGRFRVASGQRLGWSGRSGTDSPHLHFEIRRGDVAYNPLLAGVSVEDTVAPVIRSVTLAPVEYSRVNGGMAAATKLVAGAADTFDLDGIGGLLVEALDARANGQLTMAPWRIRATEGDTWAECRFDSVSWAEGMSEVDYVYDRGLCARGAPRSVLVWPADGFLSRVQHEGASGEFTVVPLTSVGLGGPGSIAEVTHRLQVEAEDAAGNWAEASVLILPADQRRTVALRSKAVQDSAFLAVLDPSWPAASAQARRRDSYEWTGGAIPGGVRLGRFTLKWTDDDFLSHPRRGVVLHRALRTSELQPTSDVLSLHPVLEPLRSPFRMSVLVSDRRDVHLGLYRDTGGGWEWIGADYDAKAHAISAETRRFGRFALFRDGVAPRIEQHVPPRTSPAGAYLTWALEARVVEEGSGVAARESYFLVDGRRVPSEWDAVAETLRWRPLRAPASGRHEFQIVVADRAGNSRRRHGSFVLD
jgi:hypothetical protein